MRTMLAAAAIVAVCASAMSDRCAAQEAPRPSPEAAGLPAGMIPFLDAHVHLNDEDMQLELMARYGVTKAVVFWGRRSDNEDIAEAARRRPDRFIPFVSISPERRSYRKAWDDQDPALLRTLDGLLSSGRFKGIGEISAAHFPLPGFPEADYDPTSPIMRGILDLARKHEVPVMLHVEITRMRELSALLDAYPDVALELISDAAKIDIVGSGFDAGVRFGKELARDMIAVPLGPPLRYVVIASPDYLRLNGVPQQPDDLLDHSCIRQRFPGGTLFLWRFEKDGRELAITPEGRLTVNDAHQVMRGVLDGIGVGRVLEDYARPFLETGEVLQVLGDWCPVIPEWHLYYPSRRQVPAAMRAFLDFLAERRREVRAQQSPLG